MCCCEITSYRRAPSIRFSISESKSTNKGSLKSVLSLHCWGPFLIRYRNSESPVSVGEKTSVLDMTKWLIACQALKLNYEDEALI